MQPRRSLRLMAGALVLALPLLSSCGFGKATDKVYTPAAGVNNRDGVVKVLSAVVVARQANSGTFIATMSNNSSTESDSLESVAPATDDENLQFSGIDPAVEINPRGYVNLADDEQGVDVRGEFAGGDFLHVTLTFTSGQTTNMKIPVVYACDEWADLDKSLDEPAPSASASASPSADVPEPGEPYDCASVLYDENSGDDTEPVVP